MDATQAWKAQRAYVEADPKHKQLTLAHVELCRQIHGYESDLRSGTFSLQRLIVARDCVEHFLNTVECTSSEEDEQMEAWTANHGEAWGGMYRQASAEITESILDLCDVLSAKRTQRKAAQLEREMAWDALRECAADLEAKYKAEQVCTAEKA